MFSIHPLLLDEIKHRVQIWFALVTIVINYFLEKDTFTEIGSLVPWAHCRVTDQKLLRTTVPHRVGPTKVEDQMSFIYETMAKPNSLNFSYNLHLCPKFWHTAACKSKKHSQGLCNLPHKFNLCLSISIFLLRGNIKSKFPNFPILMNCT